MRMAFGALAALSLLASVHARAAPPALPLPPPPSELPPAPLRRSPAYDRRPLELSAGARLWTPLGCAGVTGGACTGLGPAFGPQVSALYRASPYFALGGEALLLRAPGVAGGPGAGNTVELGAAGRVYLLEAGTIDPYLELAFGYGVAWATAPEQGGVASGPTARAGGGVDAVLVSGLRLGASIGYRQALLGRADRCSTGACVGPAGDPVEGGLVFAVSATASFGDPL